MADRTSHMAPGMPLELVWLLGMFELACIYFSAWIGGKITQWAVDGVKKASPESSTPQHLDAGSPQQVELGTDATPQQYYFPPITGGFKIPPLLGMIVFGAIFENCLRASIPQTEASSASQTPLQQCLIVGENSVSSVIRNAALTVILCRAGLGLNLKTLTDSAKGMATLRLAILPCLCEALAAGFAAHLIIGLSWQFCVALGFVLAAVSPAVVIPCMLELQDKQFGVAKGVPTIVLGAASIDAVMAITGFGVGLGLVSQLVSPPTDPSNERYWWLPIAVLPAMILGGLTIGLLGGTCVGIHGKRSPHVFATTALMVTIALTCVFVANSIRTFDLEYNGLGFLASMSIPVFSGRHWPAERKQAVSTCLNAIWAYLMPALFGLIGAKIDVLSIRSDDIVQGLYVLFIGLVARTVVSYVSIFGAGLNDKERRFVCLTQLPKATVQAAIGPLVLDTVLASSTVSLEYVQWGHTILTIAVLSILITAPIGAVLITVFGPICLTNGQEDTDAFREHTNQNDGDIFASGAETLFGSRFDFFNPPSASTRQRAVSLQDDGERTGLIPTSQKSEMGYGTSAAAGPYQSSPVN